MKKLFNKALMYQNYYTGRWPLLIGIMMFIFVTFFCMQSNLSNVMHNISGFNNNLINEGNFSIYLTSWLVLFAVYFSITGLNKKGIIEFLQSGPFTKEDIKINQILSLVITLVLLCITYVYVFLCTTYRMNDIISLVPNYYSMFIKDLIRFIVCGMAFISYVVLMDMLFSSVIFEIIMIILAPFLCVFSISFTSDIFVAFAHQGIYEISIFTPIYDFINSLYAYVIGTFDYAYIPSGRLQIISIIVLLTIVFFVITWKLNKSFKMNKSNKVFNFRRAEVIIEFFIVYNFTSAIFDIAASVFILRNNYKVQNGTSLILCLLYIICCLIVTLFIRRAVDKAVKKYL